MAAIEVITSQERDVILRQPNGETHVISVRVWNETVSNLTLMALGSRHVLLTFYFVLNFKSLSLSLLKYSTQIVLLKYFYQ